MVLKTNHVVCIVPAVLTHGGRIPMSPPLMEPTDSAVVIQIGEEQEFELKGLAVLNRVHAVKRKFTYPVRY